jgi:Holliday junction resolvasome RuvABC endonuclease subunit
VWQLLLDFERYPITEYEPKKIKMATGNGNASKEQVAKKCCTIGTERIAQNLDSTDGLLLRFVIF